MQCSDRLYTPTSYRTMPQCNKPRQRWRCWNRTHGGVINGGVSPKLLERNTIDQICATLAGFARNLPNMWATKGNVNPLCLPNLRKFARNLRPPLLRYLLFLSDWVSATVRAPRCRKVRAEAARRLSAGHGWLLRALRSFPMHSARLQPTAPQRLTGVPLASGALSVFGFCGFLRKFCGILRNFAEFCGILRIVAEFCGLFAEFCGMLRNFADKH